MAEPTGSAASSTEVIPAGHAAPSTDEDAKGQRPDRTRRAFRRGARHCVRRYRDEPGLHFPRVLQSGARAAAFAGKRARRPVADRVGADPGRRRQIRLC